MKRIIIALIIILAAVAGFFWLSNSPEPIGRQGNEADEFAKKMQQAVNHEAWERTGAVAWTFMGKRRLLWDKKRNLCQVQWDDYTVRINLANQQGKAWKGEQALEGEDLSKALDKAWRSWINDSFWLNPIAKVFDPGTERSLVDLEDGSKGLKVTYTSGGVTPGDAYLWLVDAQFRPKAWRIWTSNMPVQGAEYSWEGWEQQPTGAWISTKHATPAFTLEMKEVKAAATLEELVGTDPFADISQ